MAIRLKHINYAVISEALEGQTVCGDQYLIKELDHFTLLAVVDGLGHGEEAALAARLAIETLEANAQESIENLLKQCNQALTYTRGVAMTIVKLDYKRRVMAYKAIGNVMGVHWYLNENSKLKKQSFLLENGIVGYHLHSSMPVAEIALEAGDTLILATDGIKTQFENESARLDSPDKIAKQLFTAYRNRKDDGLILVVQLL